MPGLEVAHHAVFAVGSDPLGGKGQNLWRGVGGGDGPWRDAEHLEIVVAIAEYGEFIGAIVAHVEQQADPLGLGCSRVADGQPGIVEIRVAVGEGVHLQQSGVTRIEISAQLREQRRLLRDHGEAEHRIVHCSMQIIGEGESPVAGVLPIVQVPLHTGVLHTVIVQRVAFFVAGGDKGLKAGFFDPRKDLGGNVGRQGLYRQVVTALQIGDQGPVEVDHRQFESEIGEQLRYGYDTAGGGDRKMQPVGDEVVETVAAELRKTSIGTEQCAI